jgi:hypothetical protein
MSRRRKRKHLADVDLVIGPATRRLQAVRDGIKGVRRALDRGSCRDAVVLLRLTEAEAKRIRIGPNEREQLADEKSRLTRACRR